MSKLELNRKNLTDSLNLYDPLSSFAMALVYLIEKIDCELWAMKKVENKAK